MFFENAHSSFEAVLFLCLTLMYQVGKQEAPEKMEKRAAQECTGRSCPLLPSLLFSLWHPPYEPGKPGSTPERFKFLYICLVDSDDCLFRVK